MKHVYKNHEITLTPNPHSSGGKFIQGLNAILLANKNEGFCNFECDVNIANSRDEQIVKYKKQYYEIQKTS